MFDIITALVGFIIGFCNRCFNNLTNSLGKLAVWPSTAGLLSGMHSGNMCIIQHLQVFSIFKLSSHYVILAKFVKIFIVILSWSSLIIKLS